MTWGDPLGNVATRPRQNRTITVASHDDNDLYHMLGNGKVCLEWVLACILPISFQLKPKTTCRGGGGLTLRSVANGARIRRWLQAKKRGRYRGAITQVAAS